MAKMVLEIELDQNATQMVDVYGKALTAPYVFINEIENLLNGLSCGAYNGVINAKLGAVQAQITGTFTGQPTANDTIVVNGVTFTAVSEVSTPTELQFKIGTTVSLAASNLAAAINASTTAGVLDVVVASSLLGVITFKSKQAGKAGNAIILSESLGNFTLAATRLAGGTHSSGSNLTYLFGKAATTAY